MRPLFIILSFFLLSSPVIGQSECDESTRTRMIKSGISDKTIEDQCGKIGEEEQVSEILEKTEYDLADCKNILIRGSPKRSGL